MSLRSNLAAAVTRIAHSGERSRVEADAPADELPDAFHQLLTRPWRAQPEDTVGGWCITLAEDPRAPSGGALAIAMFLSRDLATHIAAIHNSSLDDAPVPPPAPGAGPAPVVPGVVGPSVPRQGAGTT